MKYKEIQVEELRAWSDPEYHFLELLNGNITLEETLENILSFRNSKFYTGNEPEFMVIFNEDES